ncbi:MAG: 50S ribosomal protein L1 [Candidatus Nanoarchaeia archaeon]
MEVKKALQELRKEKRKFNQTIDIVINLKDVDLKKDNINFLVNMPHPLGKKICGFLTRKVDIIDTITPEEFDKYKEPKQIKKLAKKYDAFIASASLMKDIASKFGRYLGPSGKMPNPQAGIIPTEDDKKIKDVVEMMKKVVKLRPREKSIKIGIGKEDMDDKKIEENVNSIISAVESKLPKGKENIKNILIKLTMSKPVRLR